MTARILIIDDEPHLRETMRMALEADGYHVEAAANGGEGLAKFGSGEGWDLVLLDYRMPGLDGTEVLRRLHAADRTVPVLLITAYGSIDLTQATLASGARGFITKPISVGELRDVVARTLTPRPSGEGKGG